MADASKRSKPIYFILGHGSENLRDFDERRTCPANVTLVIFSSCGNLVYTKDKTPEFISIAADPSKYNLLKSPTRNEDELCHLLTDPICKHSYDKSSGCDIHIYRPGDKIPNLYNNLSLDFDRKIGGIPSRVYFKSGVFQYPIDTSSHFIDLNDARSGNIYPVGVKSGAEYSVYNMLKKIQSRHDREHIIVYYVSCRNLESFSIATELIRTLSLATINRVIADPSTQYRDQKFDEITDPDVQKLVKNLISYGYDDYKLKRRIPEPIFRVDNTPAIEVNLKSKSLMDDYICNSKIIYDMIDDIRRIVIKAREGKLEGDERKLDFFLRAPQINRLSQINNPRGLVIKTVDKTRSIRVKSAEQQRMRRSRSKRRRSMKKKMPGYRRTVASRHSDRELSIE